MLTSSLLRFLLSLWLLSFAHAVLFGQTPLPPLLADASAQAAAEKKLLLVEFYSYNSVESRVLKERVIDHAEVKTVLSVDFVSVRVEFERQEEVRLRYGVTLAPTVILLKSDGMEIDRITGVPSVKDFTAFLKAAAAGSTEISELRTKAAGAGANAESYLLLGDALLRRQKHGEAVEAYDRCLECILKNLQMENKHLKPLLTRIAALRRGNNAGVNIIRTRRDGLEAAVRRVPNALVLALFDLNEALGDLDRSVAFYRALPQGSPWKERAFGEVFLALVEKQDYTEATNVIDLEVYVIGLYPRHIQETATPELKSEKGRQRGTFETTQRKRLVDNSVAAVEALLATSQLSKARRVAERLLEYADNLAIRARLSQAAVRAASEEAKGFEKWFAQIPAPKAQEQLKDD